MRQGREVCAVFGSLIRGPPSENTPPRQRRGGGEHDGTGVAEEGSRGSRLGSPQPHRERRKAGRRGGGDQADPPGCIAVEDRARQEECGSDGEKGDGRHVPRDVDHRLRHPGTTEATGGKHSRRQLSHYQDLASDFNPALTGGEHSGWRARVTPFEAAPGANGNSSNLDRVELEIWWMTGPTRHSFALEGFRRNVLQRGDRRF